MGCCVSGPKILTLDLETSPIMADVWGLWQNNVSLNQIHDVTRVISFGAKWYGKPKVHFYSEYHDGSEAMIAEAYELISDADIVVHFNGRKFDMPHLYREFAMQTYDPPSPVQDIDLLLAVKARFRFASNKLEHVSRQLGLEGKFQNSGHTLWVKCLHGTEEEKVKAWAEMRKYNIQDVRLTEKLYDRIRPWIKTHPHIGLFTEGGAPKCRQCGGTDLRREGHAYTAKSMYQRYQCRTCGTWNRGSKSIAREELGGIA